MHCDCGVRHRWSAFSIASNAVCILCSTQLSMGKIQTACRSAHTHHSSGTVRKSFTCDRAHNVSAPFRLFVCTRKPNPARQPASRRQCRSESFPHCTKSSPNKWIGNFRCWIAVCYNKLYEFWIFYELRICRRARLRAGVCCHRCSKINAYPIHLHKLHCAFIYHMLNSHNKLYFCTPARHRVSQAQRTNKPQVVARGTKVVNCVLLSM